MAVVRDPGGDEAPTREVSVLRSLAELRAIEVERQADEKAALEAEAVARRRAREAAEQAVRDAETARIAAERDAQIAVDTARAAAEREARLQIEAAEAAERARHLIALEERRLADEMALRREVALRQRPRWMLALTALAIVLSIGLGWFALDRYHQATLAREALHRAVAEQARAHAVLRDAQGALDRLTHDLVDLQARIDEANHRLATERTEIERRATDEMLRKLRRRAAEIEDQRRKRAEELERLQRTAPVNVSDECLRNPLCKPGRDR
jgi:hypothetical protein